MTTETWWIKRQPHATKTLAEGDPILMPSREMIEAYLSDLTPGTTRTVKEMRSALASQHDCMITCPVTTNIHLQAIAAELVAEQSSIPLWRGVEPASVALKRAGISAQWILDRQAEEAES